MQRGLGTAIEKSPREESAPRKANDCKMFTLGVYFEALTKIILAEVLFLLVLRRVQKLESEPTLAMAFIS